MVDLTAKWTELAIGSGHPTLEDTMNRMILVEHNIDGTHDRNLLNIEIVSDTAPSPTYPYQRWIDTSVNPGVERIRNRDNTAWLVSATLDPANLTVPKSTLSDTATEALNSAKLGGQVPAWYTPPGAVVAFATLTSPAGWLACDGSAVSRTTYANLFAAIGVTFGSGDGAATFNLPNTHDWFIRGASGDRAVGSTQQDSLQNVTGHFGVDHLQGNATFDGPFTKGAQTGGYGSAASGGPGLVVNFDLSAASGVRTSAETRPKNIALLYCIKY